MVNAELAKNRDQGIKEPGQRPKLGDWRPKTGSVNKKQGIKEPRGKKQEPKNILLQLFAG